MPFWSDMLCEKGEERVRQKADTNSDWLFQKATAMRFTIYATVAVV